MSPPTTGRRPTTPSEDAFAPEPVASTPRSSSAFLFEIAWEVCNQVGGIYQVLRSKAPLMVERWGNRYCMIGPYEPHKAALEFEPVEPTGFLARVAARMEASGIRVHHGYWLVGGKPRVLLLEHTALNAALGELKYALWEQSGISSPNGEPVIDRALTFGGAVQRVMAAAATELRAERGADEPAIEHLLAQFHEWQGAAAIPAIRRMRLPVAIVFTTHATQLGRYIASNEEGFYERLGSIDHAEAAARYNVRTQHHIERACAHGAHVFTTVSQITAEECTALLGRTPEIVTPNGLTISRYNVGHDFQTFHADFKARIHDFTMGYFFPHHRFDLDRTIYMFTSGRFEPRNKGFDLCLEAMARLNTELKAAGLGITVVFFIVTTRPTRSLNPLMLEKRGVLNELERVCEKVLAQVGDRMVLNAAAGEPLRLDALVEEYWQLRYRRTQAAFRMDSLPPIVTHILEDDQHDAVLNYIKHLGLLNYPDDPVKIVYHPEFIGPASPLWGLEYEQFVRGCHLGLFPSAYEPWGYTPLECMALGTPAVSSDLAGFGRYVTDTSPDHEKWGLSVLARRGRGYHDAAADLTRLLLSFCALTRRERVNLRNEVEKRSWDFDWSRLGHAYHAAHDLALARLD
jgi:glycogen(starch) synthase